MSIDSVSGLNTALRSIGLSGGLTAETSARPPASGSSASNGSQATPEELKHISADMQRKANSVTTELHFAVDQSTGRTVIRVTDRATQQLIRQIPTEELAAIINQINSFQQHMLIDQKA